MENEITKECLSKRNNLFCSTAEQYIEANINLQDYYPDIYKILNCNSDVNIFSTQIIGDKISVDGNVNIRMLYTSEDSKINVFESAVRFTKNIDIHNQYEDVNIFVVGEIDKINCKAINQRKADIKGNIILKICVYKKESEEYIENYNNESLQTKKCSFDGFDLCNDIINCFTVKEGFDIIDNDKFAKICRINNNPEINEIKTVNGKVMIKGICKSNVLYFDENGNLKEQSNEIVFSQIFDVNGVDENSICNSAISVMNSDCEYSENSGSPNGKFDVTLCLECNIKCYAEKTVNGILDAFSTKFDTDLKMINFPQIKSINSINEKFYEKYTVVCNDYTVSSVMDCFINNINYSKRSENGKLIIDGDITVGIILKATDNSVYYTERVFDFTFGKNYNFGISKSDIHIKNYSVKCNSVNGNNFDIDFNCEITGELLEIREICLVSDILINEEVTNNNGGINVYFASENEDIWDIAKHFGADIGEIKKINNIEENILSGNKTLIFSSI